MKTLVLSERQQMKMESIRRHLQPYSIAQRRATTINHAFASAIAPCDSYDLERVARAIRDLGQNPKADLKCVYCGKRAKAWDHVYGLVKAGQYSGYGHTLGNLVPCCMKCNSSKGGKEWTEFIRNAIRDGDVVNDRINVMRAYFRRRSPRSLTLSQIEGLCPREMRRLQLLQQRIISAMREADAIAAKIRDKVGNAP